MATEPQQSLAQTSIVPLIIFRIVFGLLMLAGTVRFALKGWIHELYIAPQFHFTYWGFEWIRPLPPVGMVALFALIGLCALGIAIGFHYRLAIVGFFLLFTYVELIDKTYYLNHYYLVSLLSFLLIFLPANRTFAIDSWRDPTTRTDRVPRWTIWVLRLQLGLVYFYAGVAKLQADWLLHALPLKLWLPANVNFPLIGFLFDYEWMAYTMSWGSAVFDLSVPLLLAWRRTRLFAFLLIVVFHGMTAFLFPIGIFPWLMIGSALIFFDAEDWANARSILPRGTEFGALRVCGHNNSGQNSKDVGPSIAKPHPNPPLLGEGTVTERAYGRDVPRHGVFDNPPLPSKGRVRVGWNCDHSRMIATITLTLFFALQLILPLRHHLYPGNVLWTEEGFRFAWHVMVYEKTGYAIFHITEPNSDREFTIFPSDILTPKQQEQMAIQPDMIAQLGRELARRYAKPLDVAPETLEVRAEVYASLNGRSSRLLIDPLIDLTKVKNDPWPKTWIMDGP